MGKRRARGGGGAAKDRRAQGYRARSAGAGAEAPRRSARPVRAAGSANQLTSPRPSISAPGSTSELRQPRPKALISWSSGKDSAFALHEVRRAGEFDVVGALTTVTEAFDRVSMRRSEEHTSELQSHVNLVCRLLLEKKKKKLAYT